MLQLAAILGEVGNSNIKYQLVFFIYKECTKTNYVEINFLVYESEGISVNIANKARGISAKKPVGINSEIISKVNETKNL